MTVLTEGNPKAHLSFNFGTSSARIPAASLDCMRLLTRSAPHPFQPSRLESVDAAALQELVAAGSTEAVVLGARKSAMAWRSAALSVAPCAFIDPDSSATTMGPFGTHLRASNVGVRLSAPGLWQRAQFF